MHINLAYIINLGINSYIYQRLISNNTYLFFNNLIMNHTPYLYLVGAGPGDPELITMKAVRIIRSANAILYDALANEELLEYAPSDCIKLFVGKKFGCHALSQKEINNHIVDFCYKYGRVVRLKGGDPFVFGRAQEEIDTANEFGIPWEVVPGISSSIAVPSLQGIPLTCRGISESFMVTTGTTQSGEISGDIRHAARSTATVVILMAMSKLEQIMDIFREEGKADTPVAIIQNGSRPDEKVLRGTVKDIAMRNEYYKLSNPSIIVVGEVVNLAKLKLTFNSGIQLFAKQSE
jgi:uroporphyrin-III C-methyltransferase